MTMEECVKRFFGKEKELEEGNEMEDRKTAVASPWITYARRVHKLFELDPEVKVSYDNEGPELKLYVESQEKAEALEEVMPNEVEFGNVTMAVTVVPANIAEESPYKKLLKAFSPLTRSSSRRSRATRSCPTPSPSTATGRSSTTSCSSPRSCSTITTTWATSTAWSRRCTRT